MPYSLVLNIAPISPISPRYITGRHLHALFLNLVSSVDVELGSYLHNEQTDKAFTLSFLQTLKPSSNILECDRQDSIRPNNSCWWRISLLDDRLFHQLTQLWFNLNPDKPWHLGSADLYITSILGSPQAKHPWVNVCSYEQLYENALETPEIIKFNFATPVAFRQGNYDSAMPNSESVFQSILNRWNKYSKIPFTNLSFESIYPSFFKIDTKIVSDSRSKFIGCLGNISYRILGDLDPLVIKQINTLANYAMYCGVGRKTTMGMGMTRKI
jgi:CRISPR-associated endoribonuclease Cas6